MNIQQLRYMVAIADYGTMTAAARALHTAQSAISQGVQALEDELGAELFRRDGRRVALTPAGQELVVTARRVIGDLEELPYRIDASARHGRALRIGARLGAALRCASAVNEFRRNEPDTLITITLERDRTVLAAQLREGEIDVAVTDAPFEESDFVVHELGPQEVVAMFPPGTTTAIPVPAADVFAWPMVSIASGDPRRGQMDTAAMAHGRVATASIECDDLLVGMHMVQGGGVAMLAYADVAPQAEALGLVVAPVDPPLARPILLARAHSTASELASRFWELATTFRA